MLAQSYVDAVLFPKGNTANAISRRSARIKSNITASVELALKTPQSSGLTAKQRSSRTIHASY